MSSDKELSLERLFNKLMKFIKWMLILIAVVILALVAYAYYLAKQSKTQTQRTTVYQSTTGSGVPLYSDRQGANGVPVTFNDVKVNFMAFTGLSEHSTALEPLTASDQLEYIRQETARNQQIIQVEKNRRMEEAMNGTAP